MKMSNVKEMQHGAVQDGNAVEIWVRKLDCALGYKCKVIGNRKKSEL